MLQVWGGVGVEDNLVDIAYIVGWLEFWGLMDSASQSMFDFRGYLVCAVCLSPCFRQSSQCCATT